MLQIKYNHPLKSYTSWRIGGPAKIFYQPNNLEDLILFLRQLQSATSSHPRECEDPENPLKSIDSRMRGNDAQCGNQEPIFYLGNGSNVLIPDAGFNGTVIHTIGLTELTKITDTIIRVQAGVTMPRLTKYLPFLAGIPGTVGGALAMNAGAYGEEIWDHVINVTTIDRCGKVCTRQPSEFNINYRQVIMPAQEWFVSAQLSYKPLPPAEIKAIIRDLIAKRIKTQPIGQPTCGSVFRNPPGNSAGRLIEQCGLKGYVIGGAQVSSKHANFIVNTGNATAANVANLIKYIQEQVQKKHGIVLVPEVIYHT